MDFKIAVCDDEAYFRDRIKELLQKYFAEKGLSVSIDLYDSGASFCSDPDNFKAYDVVFLDIEMREMNGMETAYASLQADVISVALLTGLFLLCAVSTQFGGYYIYRMMAAVASILFREMASEDISGNFVLCTLYRCFWCCYVKRFYLFLCLYWIICGKEIMRSAFSQILSFVLISFC